MNLGFLYVFITAVAFATLEPVSKVVATDISPLALTAIRFLIGGLMLLPFSLREIKRQKIHLNIYDHVKMLGLGVLTICISMVMLQYSIKLAQSPALIAIVFSSNSVMTICISALLLKEKITAKKVLALILCIIGIFVCSWDSLSANNGALSIILAVLAALTFSLYTVFNKKMMSRASGNILIGFSFVYGSIVLLLINLIIGGTVFTSESIGIREILITLYLGVVVTGIGYWSYFKALEKSSATTASLAFFVKPILAPFVAFFVTGTPLTIETFIALAFVVVGSYMVSYADKVNKR